MKNSIKQSNFDEIFAEKLTSGSISACLFTELDQFSVQCSFRADYYSEGILNGNFQFAAFQTSRDAVIFVEYRGQYFLTFYREFFWSDECFKDGCGTEDCFQQCIAILSTHPE